MSYESAMWLEEPRGHKAKVRDGRSNGELEGGEKLDNPTAGGFFQQYGRKRTGARPNLPRICPTVAMSHPAIRCFARPAASPAPTSPGGADYDSEA